MAKRTHKAETIKLRLTPEEASAARTHCHAHGWPLSAFVRRAMAETTARDQLRARHEREVAALEGQFCLTIPMEDGE